MLAFHYYTKYTGGLDKLLVYNQTRLHIVSLLVFKYEKCFNFRRHLGFKIQRKYNKKLQNNTLKLFSCMGQSQKSDSDHKNMFIVLGV